MPLSNLLRLAVALALLTPVLARAGDAKSAEKKDDTSDAIDSMCKMIPEGRRNLKVHYPGFDSSGKPTSLVTAAAMTRLNPKEMFAEKLRIDLFGQEPKDNLRVDLKTGTYHMDTKMLTSNEHSRVTRSDFRIDGDAMEFDMTSSQGKMIGNVRMVIYDSSSFSSSKTAAPAPAKEPAPSAK